MLFLQIECGVSEVKHGSCSFEEVHPEASFCGHLWKLPGNDERLSHDTDAACFASFGGDSVAYESAFSVVHLSYFDVRIVVDELLDILALVEQIQEFRIAQIYIEVSRQRSFFSLDGEVEVRFDGRHVLITFKVHFFFLVAFPFFSPFFLAEHAHLFVSQVQFDELSTVVIVVIKILDGYGDFPSRFVVGDD